MQVIDNKRVKFREFGKWWFDKHGILLCPFEDHATLNSLILERGLKNAASFLENFYSNIHSFFTIISSKVPLYYILKNDELLTLNCLPIRDIEQLTKIVLCDLTEESMLETPDGKRAIELFVLIQCQYALKNDPLCACKIDPPWEVFVGRFIVFQEVIDHIKSPLQLQWAF